MVKEIFSNIVLFAALVIAVSSFAGCGGNTGTGSSTGGNAAQTANGSEPKKKSNYPPLVAKAAQADMKHLDGSTSKVADRKGKVLLLNMWATWCGPCRAEMPELVKMQDEFREKGFEIIGLNTDDGDTPEMVNDFAKEMSLNYTLVWASTEMQKELLKISKYEGIPQSFLIDRDGNLRGVFKGASVSEIQKMKATVTKVISGEDSGAVVVPDAPVESNTSSAPSDSTPGKPVSKTEEKKTEK